MSTADARAASPALDALLHRYDPTVVDPAAPPGRVRLVAGKDARSDVVADGDGVRVVTANGEPDALLTADDATWARIARDLRGGTAAFDESRLRIRRSLHHGVSFLAATSGATGAQRLRFASANTPTGPLSYLRAGSGEQTIVAIHGLGATKASFLTTVAALADAFTVIAVDLPGFGESTKPIGADYDARFFAEAIVQLLDALGLERAHLVGNSLGGRVALEVALRHPDRVDRLALLAPSMAWRRKRPWAPLLRLVRPELGLLQPTPRSAIEAFVARAVPGASNQWVAAGIDEFLRSYLTPRGRAAFYAAARQIYLEEPEGDDGFWPRLRDLRADALWVWGRQDTLVPLAFARHVTEALPDARHLELNCGHVPQLERPRETHDAIRRLFTAG